MADYTCPVTVTVIPDPLREFGCQPHRTPSMEELKGRFNIHDGDTMDFLYDENDPLDIRWMEGWAEITDLIRSLPEFGQSLYIEFLDADGFKVDALLITALDALLPDNPNDLIDYSEGEAALLKAAHENEFDPDDFPNEGDCC